ncbi:MAG TPA: DUF1592 domain-containing protein, partial [Vicinamibacterales bacterium]|nr:DUF1592 domain-containing protein [Vicinamibacterales bacterium]
MRTHILTACLAAAFASGIQLASAAEPADPATQKTIVTQYCVPCHNARLKTANLLLDQVDFATLGQHPDLGEKIVRKLRAGMMPPTNNRRPDAPTMESLISGMEVSLDKSASPHLPPPGLHRLNRTEYTNAVRDLLDLKIDATRFLPSDDSTRGFDNIAGALTMSPALMEAYLSAAGKISRLAIGDVNSPSQAVFDVPGDTAQNHHVEGLPFGTRGGLLIPFEFPVDGEYTFRVKGVTGYFQAVLGSVKGEQLEVTIDGERVKLFDWDKELANSGNSGGRATPRIPVKAGLHNVGVTFLATNDIPGSELNRPFQRTMNTPGTIPGFVFYPHLGQVWIDGPFNPKGATDTPSRRKIFTCRPSTSLGAAVSASNGRPNVSGTNATGKAAEDTCARRIVATLARHAYRRPATAADVKTLMDFYQEGRVEGGSFDAGIEAALQRVLTDVEFIYRGEPEPKTLAAGKAYHISDLALASRLSFFVWSSIPDDELIDVAARGQLRTPAVLEKQVRRMLADPKSSALIDNFVGQWLNVRGLNSVEPVVNIFPDFDDNLRLGFRKEVELFFDAIVHEDRSALDLLTADYTFVNERLAKHYGIPGVYGSQFRRVTLPPELDMRRGLLGKGALLTVTSNAAHTSPVARGKWFQTTFLGVEPPGPPPGVDTSLKERVTNDTGGNLKIPTMRDVMDRHHQNPVCASCHKIFEPIGIAFENFDATGAWRTFDEGSPIDANQTMIDGTKVE